jgi:carboxypeptidase Q
MHSHSIADAYGTLPTMRLFASCLLVSLAFASAEDLSTLDVVGRIKAEAFDHSHVMDTLSYLSDVYGPRLTASPEFNEAAKWAMDRLKSYGISNVHEEAWGPFGRSWSIESYTVDMVTPRYSHLVASPLAWSGPTKGDVTGEALLAPMPPRSYNPKKMDEQIDAFEAKWKGKLSGKVILITTPKITPPRTNPLFTRYTDARLAEIANAPEPAAKEKVDLNNLPDDTAGLMRVFGSMTPADMDEFFARLGRVKDKLNGFLLQEHVLGVLVEDPRSHDGANHAEAAGSEKASSPLAPPTFVVDEEQYTRMARLLEKNIPVTVKLDLKVRSSDTDQMGEDIIGEIPGTSEPDQVVMIGAHFDSWHSGTGATDNGAGSAVMMEVMRILKTLNLPMKRTVRIGLWSGEEQGIYGSAAYVKAHFGNANTMEFKPEQAKLDAYLNLDNGSGKIRGVYLQGDDAARPVFEKMLQPFRDMGATTITLKNTSGTDHLSFDAVDLPGFQFIQDPLDYGSLVHHSSLDTYSHAIPEDLMQASAIIASCVYDIANADRMFPRKPLPHK